MSQELTYLLWSAALAFAYLLAQAAAYGFQIGLKAANSTRDSEPEPNLMTGQATFVWFWARVAYLPAYLMGLGPYRSWI